LLPGTFTTVMDDETLTSHAGGGLTPSGRGGSRPPQPGEDHRAEDETLVAPGTESATIPPAPQERDLSGTTLGEYRLNRKIAEGGMGEVYEATQLKLDRKVAVKVLTSRLAGQSEFLHRFEREAKAAAALNHPNVVQVHDFGVSGGRYYLVMEFVEGEDLADYLRRVERLAIPEALDAVEQAARALKAARAQQIIHRDVKPANLMRTTDGLIKVSDLGLAKRLSEATEVTATGVGIGSPHFLAPEQADDAAHVDHRADIYSLGITLFYLLTGRKPFDGTSAFSVVMAHVNKPLPSGAEVGTELPDEVEEFIRRMTAKRPEERYQDYDSLLKDLERVKAGYAPAEPLFRPLREWFRSTGLKMVAAMTMTALIVLAVIVLRPTAEKSPDSPGANEPLPTVTQTTAPSPPPNLQGARRTIELLLPWPLGEIPNRTPIPVGPIDQMITQGEALVRANTNDFKLIIHVYQQLASHATNEAQRQAFIREEVAWVTVHQFAAAEAVQKYTALMNEQLRARQPQAAYDVWKDFPQGLRTYEVDQEILRILNQYIPPGFQPAR
jgi:serine/threonine protein kinase